MVEEGEGEGEEEEEEEGGRWGCRDVSVWNKALGLNLHGGVI